MKKLIVKLSLKEQLAINEAVLSLDSGLGISHEEVVKQTKKRYFKYFKK